MSAVTNARKIACIGEAMVELTLGSDEQHETSLGFAGDTLNTAIYLRRLMNDNCELAYITVLGNDSLSQRMCRFIESESINTDSVQFSSERQIGLYAIDTDQQGERSFSYWRSQSAARTLFQQADTLNFDVLADYDTLYFSAITLAILPATVRSAFLAALSGLRQDKDTTIVFDSNYRPALWESDEIARSTVADAWRITDIALPSLDDEQALFQDRDENSVLNRLKSYGINRGALKRGARGPLSLGPQPLGPQPSSLPAEHSAPVCVVDTTAAGDSFNAGYLSGALSGIDEHEALAMGHDCALRVIAHSGAIIPLGKWPS